MALSARAPRAGDPFWDLLVRDAHALWDMNPRDFAAVMMAESGIDPDARNPGGAVGINQISDPKNYAPLTSDQYRALTASDQWELAARKFFDGVIKAHPSVKEAGARDLYWINFVPATYRSNAPDDFAIIEPGKRYGNLSGDAILKENALLILPGDDTIRPAGLTAFMARNFGSPRWKEILGAIDAAELGQGIALNGPGTRPAAHQETPTAPKIAQASLAGPAVVLGLFGLWAWARSRRAARR